MVNFPGRTGRRRRVLNEEVLSASGSLSARQASAASASAAQAQRYSDAAGVENHPQITDFVPRRYRTIVLMVACGLATAVILAGLHQAAPAFFASAGMPEMRTFDLSAPGSLAVWVSSVVLALTSAVCFLVYSIRRHRIDDYRGRYRIWTVAGAACLLLSANSVTGLHQVLGYALAQLTGWTALRDGAAWWLVLGGLPLAWIAVRTLLDVKDCRLATSLLVAAILCHGAAAASFLGMLPFVEPQSGALLTGTALLLGHWLTFSAVVSYARFVVLDAQGLIAVRSPKTEKRSKQANSSRDSNTNGSPSLLATAGYTRQPKSEAAASKEQWVDGSRPIRESYDEDEDDTSGPSKLSKADRKRLRKLKCQNRAA